MQSPPPPFSPKGWPVSAEEEGYGHEDCGDMTIANAEPATKRDDEEWTELNARMRGQASRCIETYTASKVVALAHTWRFARLLRRLVPPCGV